MTAGSTTRGGHTVAETLVGVYGHGTPMIAGFMEEVVAWYGRRPGMEARFEPLLSMSRAGRRPAGRLPGSLPKNTEPLGYACRCANGRFGAIAN